MSVRSFLDGKVILHSGDCREVLASLPEASVDSIVTDPPYALTAASRNGSPRNNDPETPFGRTKLGERGFMGKTWDVGDTAFAAEFWQLALRCLKPGGHIVAFGGTRTYHRLACAIEDAGFEIRDCVMWVYGSGFPKSLDVSKAIDKAARGVPQGGTDPTSPNHGRYKGGCSDDNPSGRGFGAGPGQFMAECGVMDQRELVDAAREWQGWGTALKPAVEPIVLARKPLIGTVAANVQKHGTGALNIDGCRIHADDAQGGAYTVKRLKPGATLDKTGGNWRPEDGGIEYHGEMKPGRWPANICHDGSPEVMACFPETPGQLRPVTGVERAHRTLNAYGDFGTTRDGFDPRGDSGSAARFFFTAKADSHDRIASKHPTVKPLDLMQWLCRLVTPKGGTVLDPFAGTGTTGEAAWREGFRAILIEREAEYQADIARRMDLAENPTKRAAVAKTKGKIDDHGPLFSGGDPAP